MTTISSNQFEVLSYIESRQSEKHSQRLIADAINVSVGTINKIISDFLESNVIIQHEKGYFSVTDLGYSLLEPYRVKRAVILAAGFGSRLVPITLNTPKPLILVHGKRIIDTLLDAIVDAGIKEIVIVRGYLKEQFDVLLTKYPNIRFIENSEYNETNNISSAYCAKELFENAYILEADLIIHNKNVIRKYEYTSNYTAYPMDRTDDWCFKTKKDIITDVSVGGENVQHMIGISYWTKEDAKKLAVDIHTVFNSPGGKQRYWDEVALRFCKDHYEVLIRKIKPNDIIEIDTFGELKAIDKIYDC